MHFYINPFNLISHEQKNNPLGPNIFSEFLTWLKGLNIEMDYHKKVYFQDVLRGTPRIHPHTIDYSCY